MQPAAHRMAAAAAVWAGWAASLALAVTVVGFRNNQHLAKILPLVFAFFAACLVLSCPKSRKLRFYLLLLDALAVGACLFVGSNGFWGKIAVFLPLVFVSLVGCFLFGPRRNHQSDVEQPVKQQRRFEPIHSFPSPTLSTYSDDLENEPVASDQTEHEEPDDTHGPLLDFVDTPEHGNIVESCESAECTTLAPSTISDPVDTDHDFHNTVASLQGSECGDLGSQAGGDESSADSSDQTRYGTVQGHDADFQFRFMDPFPHTLVEPVTGIMFDVIPSVPWEMEPHIDTTNELPINRDHSRPFDDAEPSKGLQMNGDLMGRDPNRYW